MHARSVEASAARLCRRLVTLRTTRYVAVVPAADADTL